MKQNFRKRYWDNIVAFVICCKLYFIDISEVFINFNEELIISIWKYENIKNDFTSISGISRFIFMITARNRYNT